MTKIMSSRLQIIAALAFFTLTAHSAQERGAAIPLRGLYEASVQLSIETNESRVFFTTDGSDPSPQNGRVYEHPLILTNTTVLRTAAFQKEKLLGGVTTHTYVFPHDIVRQTGTGFPTTWGTNNGAAVPGYYQMA